MPGDSSRVGWVESYETHAVCAYCEPVLGRQVIRVGLASLDPPY